MRKFFEIRPFNLTDCITEDMPMNTQAPTPSAEITGFVPTDADLMRKIAAGGEKAFRALTERHAKRVFALLWRLCGDRSDAEDLTQETFLRVWKNADRWTPDARLETWLYRIAYNLFIDSCRREKPRTTVLDDDLRSDADTPEQALMRRNDAERVKRALDSLPDRQREALALCYYQGLKAKDAAEILSVTQGALESLLFRARQTMKEILSADKGGSP